MWLDAALENQAVDEAKLRRTLSAEAQQVRTRLEDRGACFVEELQRTTGLTMEQVESALWELTTAGLAAADGFDQLRIIMDSKRKSAAYVQRLKNPTSRPRSTAGRWYLLPQFKYSISLASFNRAYLFKFWGRVYPCFWPTMIDHLSKEMFPYLLSLYSPCLRAGRFRKPWRTRHQVFTQLVDNIFMGLNRGADDDTDTFVRLLSIGHRSANEYAEQNNTYRTHDLLPR